MNKFIRVTIISCVLFHSCDLTKKKALFTLLDDSGVDFKNTLIESKKSNVFNYRNFYNGGGVAIGDLNNDGLSDIFFTGNQVSNRLYLNLGKMKFKDISETAGFSEKKQWSTGVTLVDINHDGWLDIYVCNAGNMMDSLLRKNQLFINNQNLTFSERAMEYGLAETGYTTHASFFDYDLDGDLDCFMIDNSPIPANTLNFANKRSIEAKYWDVAPFLRGGGDHLYKNNNGIFIEVTKEAGIHGSLISLGLGVTVSDVNRDGYPDVFVSNDFFERDYLYINQKNGTFQDEIEDWVQHMSLSSMGTDMQDVNNDGYPDIFTTDMLPDNDYRLKTTSTFDNYDTYHLKEKNGFYHQFMQNTLQINNQNGRFMETAFYSGVSATDWSWGALMFDADNDGLNDLYVCNGIRYDLTDQDFINFFSSSIIQDMVISKKKEEMNIITDKMTSSPLPNRVFKNNGDFTFSEKADEWGFSTPSFSNGASYGDLDNDGDLDLVVSNINEGAFVYRNNSRDLNKNNYISFILKGSRQNTFAVGSKIQVYSKGQIFWREEIPSRGFQSSVDYKISIGLGSQTEVDSVLIIWPEQEQTKLINPKLNTIHTLELLKENSTRLAFTEQNRPTFSEVSTIFKKHEEDEYVDFYTERNLPRMLSKQGPRAAVGDVNGDQLDDLYICGGGANKSGILYLQTKEGSFTEGSLKSGLPPVSHEEVVSIFFDCDKDDDLDLYIGSGGNNQPLRSPHLDHQLFRNDGKGNFLLINNAFPQNQFNVGAALSIDFDRDGDLDLFVGAYSTSFLYGVTPESVLFTNDGQGRFTEEPAFKVNDLRKLGMVTGTVQLDIEGDKKDELVIIGEWMYPKILQLTKQGYKEINSTLSELNGWWQSIAAADLDGDGRKDLVLGNIGENFYLKPDSLNPVRLWVNYFGIDGSIQQVLTRTVDNKDVPIFMKKTMEEQFLYLKKKNLEHSSYAVKSLEQLFDKQLVDEAIKSTFDFCPSVIAWNEGNGRFTIEKLPPFIQFSSVNAIHCTDVNNDGMLDVVTGGNIYDFTPQLGRLDSNFGSVLMNQGSRRFRLSSAKESGIQISGEVRDIKSISINGVQHLVFLRNNNFPTMYKSTFTK
jgi:enediyne biosynthesis protein E4